MTNSPQEKPVGGQHSLRLLLVEDNSADAELCVHELKAAGYEVTADVVETADDFIERLRTQPYDIVISDYNLPNWTGMEALERLREEGIGIPFILLTGTLGEERAVECIKNGASDYVLKDRRARLSVAVERSLEEAALRARKTQDERSLRLLSGRLLQLQDEERRRMARELHDTTAQNLAALAMNLEMLKESTATLDANLAEQLSESCSLAEQCTQELRTFSYLLHPPLLDEAGLASAVRWFAEGFTKRSGVQVDLNVSPNVGRLPGEAEMALFRILQESLANIHRHSGSPTGKISITQDATKITLEVSDQGRGMLEETLKGEEVMSLGVGIMGMRERMKQLGGTLDLRSGSEGTTVIATLPHKEQE